MVASTQLFLGVLNCLNGIRLWQGSGNQGNTTSVKTIAREALGHLN